MLRGAALCTALAFEVIGVALLAHVGCGSSVTREGQGDFQHAADAGDGAVGTGGGSGSAGGIGGGNGSAGGGSTVGAGGAGGDGCVPHEHYPDCPYEYVGDATKPIEMELVAATEYDGPNVPMDERSAAPLILGPKGGWAILAGVRATNLDPCDVTLEGMIRDETSNQTQYDARFVNIPPTGDGWAETSGDSWTYANIFMCPNLWSDTNIYGTEYELTVTLTDVACRTATKTIHVVPYCAWPSDDKAYCLCECRGGYVLGEDCQDGGI